jgi:hypothetical protein
MAAIDALRPSAHPARTAIAIAPLCLSVIESEKYFCPGGRVLGFMTERKSGIKAAQPACHDDQQQ